MSIVDLITNIRGERCIFMCLPRAFIARAGRAWPSADSVAAKIPVGQRSRWPSPPAAVFGPGSSYIKSRIIESIGPTLWRLVLAQSGPSLLSTQQRDRIGAPRQSPAKATLHVTQWAMHRSPWTRPTRPDPSRPQSRRVDRG